MVLQAYLWHTQGEDRECTSDRSPIYCGTQYNHLFFNFIFLKLLKSAPIFWREITGVATVFEIWNYRWYGCTAGAWEGWHAAIVRSVLIRSEISSSVWSEIRFPLCAASRELPMSQQPLKRTALTFYSLILSELLFMKCKDKKVWNPDANGGLYAHCAATATRVSVEHVVANGNHCLHKSIAVALFTPTMCVLCVCVCDLWAGKYWNAAFI